jgi:uncharacterized protein DUF5995
MARIQPAAWFRHALSLGELVETTESRARALECGRDGRAAFARLRAAQVGRVAGLLDAGGFGAAAAWIERLELEHGHRYLRAADGWDRGDLNQTPTPWRAIFEHERGHRPDAAASLRTGTIAYLMFDLPLALARVGVTTADGVDTATAYAQLTEMYAVTTDEAVCAVSVHLRRPYLGYRRQPTVTDAWQRELRGQAWDDAAELLGGDQHEREVALRRIELAAMCEIRRLIGASR